MPRGTGIAETFHQTAVIFQQYNVLHSFTSLWKRKSVRHICIKKGVCLLFCPICYHSYRCLGRTTRYNNKLVKGHKCQKDDNDGIVCPSIGTNLDFQWQYQSLFHFFEPHWGIYLFISYVIFLDDWQSLIWLSETKTIIRCNERFNLFPSVWFWPPISFRYR